MIWDQKEGDRFIDCLINDFLSMSDGNCRNFQCISVPFQTRVMAAAKVPAGGVPEFSGPIDCAVKLLRRDGPLAFYKGFIPNFARIGSWNIVTWVTLEQLKAAYWAYQEKNGKF